MGGGTGDLVSYTRLRAHETSLHLVCRFLLEKPLETMTVHTVSAALIESLQIMTFLPNGIDLYF